MDYIVSLKGIMEYRYAEKATIEDALLWMCIYADLYFAGEMGMVNPKNRKEVEEFIDKRIKQFSKDEEAADKITSKLESII